MGSTSPSLSPATSRPGLLNVGAVLRLWDLAFSTLSNPSAFLSYFRPLLQPLYHNGTLNWGNALILSTCVIAMAACGFLSSLLRRKSSKKSSERRRFRRSAQRNFSKSSAGTTTSSEEDEYDSAGSLRFGTERALPEEKAIIKRQEQPTDALSTDPGLLKKRSSYISYTTSVATYPSIRTFFSPHPHSNKLPTKPTPMPLLVFVHGLGGSLAQFSQLLTSLANVGPCFGIDLPGCGLSAFAPTSWDAYTVEALAELLFIAIEQHRDKEAGQDVVLIGHSLGCSISVLLASSTSPIGTELKKHILGFVAVCPRASPPSPQEASSVRRLLRVPEPIFNLWCFWDRRGGVHSTSVNRVVGTDADPDTRELQLRYNKQSKTPVWRRMAWGTLPTYDRDGKAAGGIPGEEVWAGVQTPVLLVAGESDAVTKPAELKKILQFFGDNTVNADVKTNDSSIVPDASRVHDQVTAPYNPLAHEEEHGIEVQTNENELTNNPQSSVQMKRTVKTVILPAPASHALLYDRATYRTLAGIIQDFLRQHVDERLSLGWQLQYMNTSGKWDVKNLVKWQKVAPVSEPIADTFVALKMLREVDEEHNPVLFSEKYRDKIYAVIDISYESPVYNPASMEKGGIHYHKHPTVSKLPPSPDDVREFIALVDQLENEIDEKLEKSGDRKGPRPVVGVHCHYGYNRTGFMIVSYLIERKGFGVQEAIDEFERRRPPGIRHGHFIDTLFVRYCVGLKRAPTL